VAVKYVERRVRGLIGKVKAEGRRMQVAVKEVGWRVRGMMGESKLRAGSSCGR
jgi:hypothetical protein